MFLLDDIVYGPVSLIVFGCWCGLFHLTFYSLFQLFLVKNACLQARVLDKADCPPCGIPYNKIDYPLFYDALYYPELHRNIFLHPFAVSCWLESSLHHHVKHCCTCSRVLGLQDLACSVEYVHNIGFIISFEGYKRTHKAVALIATHRILLKVDFLSSPSYTYCISSFVARFPDLITSTLSCPNIAEYESCSTIAAGAVYLMLDLLPYNPPSPPAPPKPSAPAKADRAPVAFDKRPPPSEAPAVSRSGPKRPSRRQGKFTTHSPSQKGLVITAPQAVGLLAVHFTPEIVNDLNHKLAKDLKIKDLLITAAFDQNGSVFLDTTRVPTTSKTAFVLKHV
jgi:hypothetical protein